MSSSYLSLFWCAAVLPVCQPVSWIVADELGAHALDNLTAEENHELLLKQLDNKNVADLLDDLLLEFVTMATGNDFYCLTADAAASRENRLVAKTVVELSYKLPFQKLAYNMIADALTEGFLAGRQSGRMAGAVTTACRRLHELFGSHADYAQKRREAEGAERAAGGSRSLFYCTVPRDAHQLRSILASVRNMRQFKRIFVNFALFDTTTHAEAVEVEGRMLRLLRNTRNDGDVQTLYDESVAETVRGLRDLQPREVDLSTIFRDADEYRTMWARIMKKKLDEHPTFQFQKETSEENIYA